MTSKAIVILLSQPTTEYCHGIKTLIIRRAILLLLTTKHQFNASTLYPDQEELNRDNTMNEVEEYFQYKVDLYPGMDMSNNPYITDVSVSYFGQRRTSRLKSGTSSVFL